MTTPDPRRPPGAREAHRLAGRRARGRTRRAPRNRGRRPFPCQARGALRGPAGCTSPATSTAKTWREPTPQGMRSSTPAPTRPSAWSCSRRWPPACPSSRPARAACSTTSPRATHTGLLYSPHERPDLTRAVRMLLTDPALAARLAAHGRAHVRGLSWRAENDRLLERYAAAERCELREPWPGARRQGNARTPTRVGRRAPRFHGDKPHPRLVFLMGHRTLCPSEGGTPKECIRPRTRRSISSRAGRTASGALSAGSSMPQSS